MIADWRNIKGWGEYWNKWIDKIKVKCYEDCIIIRINKQIIQYKRVDWT